MADLKAIVTRKVGPLPLWGWVLAGGVVFYVVRKRATGQALGGTPGEGGGIGAGAPEIPTTEGEAGTVDYYGGDGGGGYGAPLYDGDPSVVGVGGGSAGVPAEVPVPGASTSSARRNPVQIIRPTAGIFGQEGNRLCPPGWHYSVVAGGCVPRGYTPWK
jgi:hypothetical protein